jgi:DNA invertase Pin-like site-specific DNA recombinase
MMVLDSKIEKGTILLIEAFDRLTRLPLPDAYEVLLSLVNNGLTLVTLTDGKVWSRETMSSLEAFLLSLVTLYRGHQESEHKSARLRDTFGQHRKMGSAQAFGSAPGWLRRETKESHWEIIEERAESVRKVFELAAKGMGSKAIAKRANTEGWAVPTRLKKTGERWHAQMPGQLLRNRAVLGEHEHRLRTHEANAEHWQGKSTGLVHPNYYPRIVEDDLWHRARASIDTRKQTPGRRDTNYYNIFSGLLFCGHCGAPIQRKNEQRGYSRAQLQCSDRIAGLTECPSGSARQTDEYLLDAIFAHSMEVLGDDTSGDMQERIALLDARIVAKQRESTRIADAVASTGGAVVALAAKAMELQQELNGLEAERNALQRERAITGENVGDVLLPLQYAVEQLYVKSESARESRAALHLRLARLVDTIWLWPYEVAMLKLKHLKKLIAVPLPPLQLPSRANPSAKHHRPPKPRVMKPQPIQEQALAGFLSPPEPRRATPLKATSKPFLLSEHLPEVLQEQIKLPPPIDWGDEDLI